jgi:hypothetical protein
MLPTKLQFIWLSSLKKEDFLEINQSEKRIACGSLLTDLDKMIYSNNFFFGMSNSISNLKEKETVRWGLGKS